MEKLLTYLNGLPKADRLAFVARCETSEGYLRKAISKGQRLGESLCINIDRESSGAVRCEDLRPEVDWAYLRNASAGLEHVNASAESPETQETPLAASDAGNEDAASPTQPARED